MAGHHRDDARTPHLPTSAGQSRPSIVLAPELSADVEKLWPQRVAIVQNSLTETGVLPPPRRRNGNGRYEILFVGLCCPEKGFFDILEAVAQLHAERPEPSG